MRIVVRLGGLESARRTDAASWQMVEGGYRMEIVGRGEGTMSDARHPNLGLLGKAVSQREAQDTAAMMEGCPWVGGMLTCRA